MCSDHWEKIIKLFNLIFLMKITKNICMTVNFPQCRLSWISRHLKKYTCKKCVSNFIRLTLLQDQCLSSSPSINQRHTNRRYIQSSISLLKYANLCKSDAQQLRNDLVFRDIVSRFAIFRISYKTSLTRKLNLHLLSLRLGWESFVSCFNDIFFRCS